MIPLGSSDKLQSLSRTEVGQRGLSLKATKIGVTAGGKVQGASFPAVEEQDQYLAEVFILFILSVSTEIKHGSMFFFARLQQVSRNSFSSI